MKEAELLELAEELELDDPAGWAQRVRNVQGDFVFLAGRPDMAIPLRYIEHIRANGPRGRGETLSDTSVKQDLIQGLRAESYEPVVLGNEGFASAFERYIDYYRTVSPGDGDGNPQSRTRYQSKYVFWLPVKPGAITCDEILAAMDLLSAGEWPEGFGPARIWFVRDPRDGKFWPAKAIWGLACGSTGADFNAHHARNQLRRLGFDVPGPDQPAAEIAESPESLAALPVGIDGAVRQITKNIYERDPAARRAAEKYWRAKANGRLACLCCSIDFGVAYGPRGDGFMHFHHLEPLAKSGGAQTVAATDLVPVCPNCHAMIHRGETLLTIDDMRALLGKPPRDN